MARDTNTPSAALEHEHHAIDVAVEAFANADPSELTDERRTEPLKAITLLRRHIYLEEVYLFPPLRAAGLVGPVMVMEYEHGKMWPVLDELESLLVEGISDGAALLCRSRLRFHRCAVGVGIGDRVDSGEQIGPISGTQGTDRGRHPRTH